MTKKSINIIGCGRLGKTIAKLFVQSNSATITGIVNTSLKSANEAITFIGQGKAFQSIADLPPADIYFITTPDDVIATIANQLAEKNLAKQSIIVHCSGSFSSELLNRVKEQACYAVSIHPLKSFANPSQSVASFSGTYCAIEGDAAALTIIQSLFNAIGGRVFSINKTSKSIYHAAGVMSNNYLVSLHYHALQCYLNAGVDEETAKNIVSMLMNDALNNLKDLPHTAALTGPIQRGDTQTIHNHVVALVDNISLEKETKDIYSALGLGTIVLTEHDEEKKLALRALYQKNRFI
ncbi:MAG TPA: DUF2520 domain-containing protein [Gammaproteobacteria bacterium]|nr:DUF2520 domain-containing protein [Gammaproteobacteria bacterium]